MSTTTSRNVTTPLGLTLSLRVEDGWLRSIRFAAAPETGPDSEIADEAARQLQLYFAGDLQEFHLPYQASGTPFQECVWAELERIGYGETITYGELARRIGAPAASRAVGMANGRNPLPLVIPCHRVVAANGRLGGYSGGGTDVKQLLLAHEAAVTGQKLVFA